MDSNEDVIRNLELQLSEFEMLSSMFPKKGELELNDPSAISDLHDFLSGTLVKDELSKLEYFINLEIEQVKTMEVSLDCYLTKSSCFRSSF